MHSGEEEAGNSSATWLRMTPARVGRLLPNGAGKYVLGLAELGCLDKWRLISLAPGKKHVGLVMLQVASD